MKLTNFKAAELADTAANNVKGGVFCEWYVLRTGNTHNAEKLMANVDGVMMANGNKKFA